MIRALLFILFSIMSLQGQELVIVGDKDFHDSNLTQQEVKAIFLDKKRFIEGKKVLAMNHKYNHPLRLCFERNILEKSERSLEKYWRKAYYKGKRPPKVVTSVAMLFSYFENVHPSIGYVDGNETLSDDIRIFFKADC
jgi:hypothetical protein